MQLYFLRIQIKFGITYLRLKIKKIIVSKQTILEGKGNDVLHEGDSKILELVNEMTSQIVLNQLKSLIEFIYT